MPLWQPVDANRRITLAIKPDQPSATFTRAVSDQVRAIHPNTLVSDVIAVDEQIDATLVSERLLSTLATSFSVLALGLAAIGLYGVLSYAVARRRAEFGVRMALGASRARIATGVLRGALFQVVLGLAIGLPAAILMARTAEGLLFGVTADELSERVRASPPRLGQGSRRAGSGGERPTRRRNSSVARHGRGQHVPRLRRDGNATA